MAKKNLLLVDADPKTLRMLEVSLRKAGFSVTTALGAEDAREKVQLSHPDVILTETKLPGEESGLEFVRRLKDEPHSRDIPVIFLSSEVSLEQKVKGLELGVEDYLTKPIYLKEVLTRVRVLLEKLEKAKLEKRERSATFNGVLGEMGLVDLVQTIEIGRKTGQLIVDSRGARGTIAFRDGKVVDARTGRLRGERAFYRMLVWNEGVFSMEFGSHEEADVIDLSTQGLLMEGMRRVDEWGRLLEQLPPLDRAFEIDFGELVDRLAEIPDEINGIIRLFDGQRTLLEVVDASDFGDLEALEIASKLYFEGLIYDVAAREPEEPVPEPAQVARIEAWLDEAPEEGPIVAADTTESPPDSSLTPEVEPGKKKVTTDVFGVVNVEPSPSIDDEPEETGAAAPDAEVALDATSPSTGSDRFGLEGDATDADPLAEFDADVGTHGEPPAPPDLDSPGDLPLDPNQPDLSAPNPFGGASLMATTGAPEPAEDTSPYGEVPPLAEEDVPAPPPAAFALAPPSGVEDEDDKSPPSSEANEKEEPPNFGVESPSTVTEREASLTPAEGISGFTSQESDVVAGFLDTEDEEEDEWDDVVAPAGFTEQVDSTPAQGALAEDELAQELGLSQDEVELAVAGETRPPRRTASISAIPISADGDDATLTPLPNLGTGSAAEAAGNSTEGSSPPVRSDSSSTNTDALGFEFEEPARAGLTPEDDGVDLVTADFELPGEEIHELTERKESGIHTLGPVIESPASDADTLQAGLDAQLDGDLDAELDEFIEASKESAAEPAESAATIPVQPAATNDGDAQEAEDKRDLDLDTSEIDFSALDDDIEAASQNATDIDSAAPTVIERADTDAVVAKDIADYVAESDSLLAVSARGDDSGDASATNDSLDALEQAIEAPESEAGGLTAAKVDDIEDPALTPTGGIAADFFGRLDDGGAETSSPPANDDVHEQKTPVPAPSVGMQSLVRETPDDDLRELDDDWEPPAQNGTLKAAALVALLLLLVAGAYFITKELKGNKDGGSTVASADAGTTKPKAIVATPRPQADAGTAIASVADAEKKAADAGPLAVAVATPPEEAPTTTSPGGDAPGADKPGVGKPATTPGADKPSAEKPGGDKPGGDKPSGAKPNGAKPATTVATSAPAKAVSPAEAARQKFAKEIKRAERYTRREQHAKAIRAYQAALSVRPDSATAYRGLGNAYYEMGNNDAALQNLKKAKRLNPNEPKVYVLLGAVYQSLGRKKDAIEAFEFYLRMAPTGRFARELRNIITGLKAR